MLSVERFLFLRLEKRKKRKKMREREKKKTALGFCIYLVLSLHLLNCFCFAKYPCLLGRVDFQSQLPVQAGIPVILLHSKAKREKV